MSDDKQRTPKQQKAHEYYMRNRERCLEQALSYQRAHKEKYREYQYHYFRNYKYSAAYKKRLEMERDKTKRRNQEPVNPNPVTQQLPQATPLPLEAIETTVEEIRPSFTILKPPENKVFCVSFS